MRRGGIPHTSVFGLDSSRQKVKRLSSVDSQLFSVVRFHSLAHRISVKPSIRSLATVGDLDPKIDNTRCRACRVASLGEGHEVEDRSWNPASLVGVCWQY